MRDLTIDRILEAEQKSEMKSGDNAIPYLKVGPSSVVPQEYRVSLRLSNNYYHSNISSISTGPSITHVSNGE